MALSNRARIFVYIACAIVYGLIFKLFLKDPLIGVLAGQSQFAANAVILIVLSPVWVFGAISVHYYMKSITNKNAQ